MPSRHDEPIRAAEQLLSDVSRALWEAMADSLELLASMAPLAETMLRSDSLMLGRP